jgi:uncharacterized protein (TIGR00288 family)
MAWHVHVSSVGWRLQHLPLPMSTTTQLRIALLIDADNAPAEMIDEILNELSKFGVINIRRAYGNWTKAGLKNWESKLLEFALRPMQQYDYSKRKNATDMAMTVDAMELLYTEQPDAFGIVSSDADFTPLVMHLRAKGAAVYGFGMQQTPKPFVNACSKFLYLEALDSNAAGNEPAAEVESIAVHQAAKSPAPKPESVSDRVPSAVALPVLAMQAGSPAASSAKSVAEVAQPSTAPAVVGVRKTSQQLRQDTRLMHLLRDAVKAMQDEQGWALIGAIGTQISNKASFDARNYGYATLSKLLAATQAFDMKEEGTSRVAVRDKRLAKAAPPAQGK